MKQGYKKTKLGVIPEDWEVVRVDSVFDFIKTKSLSRAQLTYENGGAYYIHYGDIHSTFKYVILNTALEKLPQVNSDIELGSNIEYLQEGDLILADASEDLDGVGACIELQNVLHKNIIGGLHTIVLRNKKGITTNGIRPYLLKSPLVLKSLKRIATGASVLGISKGNLSKIELIIPAIKEQQKIAQILSTVDEKIDLIQSQIQATQALKKGLMQQLLTKGIGHTEFKESKLGRIPANWAVVRFSDYIIQMSSGWSPKCLVEAANLGEWGSLKTTSISWDGYNPNENKKLPNYLKPREELEINLDDILITRVGPRKRVGVVVHVNDPRKKLMVSDNMLRLKISEDFNPAFLAFMLGSSLVQPNWKQKIAGLAEAQVVLNQKTIKNTFVALPPLQEQQKIANILSTVDEKLAILKEKKDQYQLLKKGLMQQLLTGKMRVQMDA